MVRILKHYKEIDYVFTEDDWFSAKGFVHACNFWKKPFHLLCPIDSLPVEKRAFREIFSKCDKIYIPNRAYMIYDGQRRPVNVQGHVMKRAGRSLKSIHAPHSAQPEIFRPLNIPRVDQFCFVWNGRDEKRKAMGRFLLALEKVQKKTDAVAFIRTDWNVPSAKKTLLYIQRKGLKVIIDQMADNPHYEMAKVYNQGDVYVSTARAGACEMGLLEAMLCGKMPLTTDFTFMNEHVIDGKTGFLIPLAGDAFKGDAPMIRSHYGSWWGNISVNALAEKMLWCYNHQSEVRRMGKLARQYVMHNYSWAKVAKRIRDEILE